MSATTVMERREIPDPTTGLLAFARRHPLVTFFVLAYALAWALILPIVFSQRGVGLFELPDALLLALFVAGTVIGPMPVAFLMTWLTEGGPGVRRLLRRMVQWNVGLRWYLVVLLGFPLMFLVGYIPLVGTAPVTDLIEHWPLLFTVFLPLIPYGIVAPGLAEEPAWRGFALPRLQARYGPLLASLILGVLHALWHTPVYFVPGAITEGGFDLGVFAGNSLQIVALTFAYTWLFNNTRGSVLFAMFVHGTMNATSQLMNQLMSPGAGEPLGRLVPVIAVLIIIAATRGGLSFRGDSRVAANRGVAQWST